MQYTSLNSNESCTAAQLIAEIMVTREADKKRITLPYKFWNLPEWKKKYTRQIISANAILKLYSPMAVLNALKRKETLWCHSLRTYQLTDIIEEEQKRLDNQDKLVLESQEIKTNNPADFRQVGAGQKSIKSKLD